jgi:HlyD family secretion protein
MKASRLSLLLFSAALVATGCVDRAAQHQASETQKILNDPIKPVIATPVRLATLTESIDLTGELTTSSDVSVGAKTAGRLVAVYVNDGDPVRRGQVIAQQDTSNQLISLQSAMAQQASAQAALTQAIANARIGPSKSTAGVLSAQAQLRSAKSQLQKAIGGARPEEKAQAEAAVSSAKSNLDTARRNRDRKRSLLQQGAISQQDLDQAENQYEAALSQYQSAQADQRMKANWTRPEDIEAAREAVRTAQENLKTAQATKQLDTLFRDQVAAARAGLQSAMAQVHLAQQSIQDAQIRAPFDGRVSGKPAQIGSVPGSGNAIARIVGREGTYFEGQVSENDLSKVSTGSAVLVSVDAIPGRTFPGHVAAISPSASSVGRLFTVRVQMDTNSAEIKPGMFARGQVTVRKIQNAVVVPTTAVVQRDGASYVFVVNGDKAHKQLVRAGLRQGDLTEVSGVKTGEKVVTTGQTDLEEGSPIKLDTALGASSARGT